MNPEQLPAASTRETAGEARWLSDVFPVKIKGLVQTVAL